MSGEEKGSEELEKPSLIEDLQHEIEDLKRKIETLKTENLELRRRAYEYHQKWIQQEEINEQLKNELAAALAAKSDFKSAVVEYMLTIREAQLTIMNALKSMRRGYMQFGMWIALTVIAVALIIYFSYYPDQAYRLQLWLSQPTNQIFVIAAIGIVAFAIFYSKRRR
jgi:DNA-directed RNA polymerase